MRRARHGVEVFQLDVFLAVVAAARRVEAGLELVLVLLVLVLLLLVLLVLVLLSGLERVLVLLAAELERAAAVQLQVLVQVARVL